jgi:hypothetical protein
MGDRRVTAFDVLEKIKGAAGDILPANWLTCLCILPVLADVVPPNELAQDLEHNIARLGGIEGADLAIQLAIGGTLLGVLQTAHAHKIDIGLALMEAIAREMDQQPPTGER